MRVTLKGVASATKKLANGTSRTYYYAWRGGPKIDGKPGSPEFIASYKKLIDGRPEDKEGAGDTLSTLIGEYRASTEFSGLSLSSKSAYQTYLNLIVIKFGDMPIEALDDLRVRGDFKIWRDSMAATPRKADYAWTTLARVMSFAKDRGRIATNPCERGGRLYKSNRLNCVWTDANLGKLRDHTSTAIWNVVTAALWTGQRQGDLLRLQWSAYDGEAIRLRQSKTGPRVTVPCGAELRAILDNLPRNHETIFLNTRQKPWTSSGFRASLGKAMAKAGLNEDDLNFHDLRGTAVTRLSIAECTVAEIATFTGHSLETVNAILDKHYLSRDESMGRSAISKLEISRNKQNSTNHLQTDKPKGG